MDFIMDWTNTHAERIVKGAKQFAGQSWGELGPTLREALIARGVLMMQLGPDNESVPVGQFNDVFRRATKLIGN